MSEPQKNKKHSTQSVEDVVEMQKHMLDPGYYVGTGRVAPHVSAPGNPKPLAIMYIVGAVLFFALGLILIFANGGVVSSGRMRALIILSGIALFCLIMGLAYFRRAKNRAKKAHSAKRKK